MAKGTEVENVEPVANWELPATSAWEESDSLDQVEGFDLEQNKEELVGVPFIIVRVTFRAGEFKKMGEDRPRDYVSVETITAPRPLFERVVPRNRRRYKDDGVPVETTIGPNETIVFNDSSTGVKRQIVSYLHQRGFVTVHPDIPRNIMDLSGELGKNPLDEYVDNWTHKGDSTEGIVIRLKAPRGLRVSNYENEFTPEGKTYYLA